MRNDSTNEFSITIFIFYMFILTSRCREMPLQWRHDGRDGVSNHQPHNCLLNFYSGTDQRKHRSSVTLAFVRGIHRWPVNSPPKWPVTRKKFPFDDVIMITPGSTLSFFSSLPYIIHYAWYSLLSAGFCSKSLHNTKRYMTSSNERLPIGCDYWCSKVHLKHLV